MTKEIIEKQNDSLKEGDILYHIGDWAWGGRENIGPYEKLMRLMRSDVTHHLILGNHDNLKPFTYVNLGFTSVHTALEVNVNGVVYYLAHDPSVWVVIPRGNILICGHVHGLFKTLKDRAVVNVGVDVWDFKPVTEQQIVDCLIKEDI